MTADEEEDRRIYDVVVNDEEQYSIWLSDRPLPSGWSKAQKTGTKSECLAHIREVWTDMRPLSLRKQLEEWERARAAEPPADDADDSGDDDPVDDLVRRLGEEQEVEASLRPTRTASLLKEAIDRGYVHMKFARTGTELGVRLAKESCDLAAGDFERGTGVIRIGGSLILNYNRVRYIGTVDLGTLAGRGRLEFVEAVAPGITT